MTFKRLSSLVLFVGCVLFSYAVANGQQTTPPTTTTTASNPRVVVTNNLAKPSTPTNSAATPSTTSTKIGNYNISVTDNIPAGTNQTLENGKFYSVTKWDGSKWVTTRKWMPNPTGEPAATKPNQ